MTTAPPLAAPPKAAPKAPAPAKAPKPKTAAPKTAKKAKVPGTASEASAKKAATPATARDSDFTVEYDIPMPAVTRKAPPVESPYKFETMKVGGSVLFPVDYDMDIADEAEREKTWQEAARTMANRVTGAVRRFTKKPEYSDYKFASRTVADDQLGFGVRVWRVAKT